MLNTGSLRSPLRYHSERICKILKETELDNQSILSVESRTSVAERVDAWKWFYIRSICFVRSESLGHHISRVIASTWAAQDDNIEILSLNTITTLPITYKSIRQLPSSQHMPLYSQALPMFSLSSIVQSLSQPPAHQPNDYFPKRSRPQERLAMVFQRTGKKPPWHSHLDPQRLSDASSIRYWTRERTA